MQLKGSDAHAVDWPGMLRAASEHRARFEQMMLTVGLTALHGTAIWSDAGYAAIAFTPSAIFDQTPGPAAGLAYRP